MDSPSFYSVTAGSFYLASYNLTTFSIPEKKLGLPAKRKYLPLHPLFGEVTANRMPLFLLLSTQKSPRIPRTASVLDGDE